MIIARRLVSSFLTRSSRRSRRRWAFWPASWDWGCRCSVFGGTVGLYCRLVLLHHDACYGYMPWTCALGIEGTLETTREGYHA
jgi:hypothetical protein